MLNDLDALGCNQLGVLHSRAVLPLATPKYVGQGECVGHHGELFQGVQQTAEGRLRRCLLTLPRPDLFSRAEFILSKNSRHIDGLTPGKFKAFNAARHTLDALGLHQLGGVLRLSGNIPDARGHGASTADVVATIRAVSAAAGAQLSDNAIAGLAIDAEIASDALMFMPKAMLFAYREGTAIENYAPTLPAMVVLGFDTAPNSSGIDTIELTPAHYNADEIFRFQTLLALLPQALARGDIATIGRVASESARINQRFLPIAQFNTLEMIAASTGAIGVQVAHSGTVAGFLYDPTQPRLRASIAAAKAALLDLNCAGIHQFSTQRAA